MLSFGLAISLFVTDTLVSSQQARIVQRDGVPPPDNFGVTVALDADTLVVGAPQEDPLGLTNAGSAYVFVRVGAAWSQQAKLIAGDASAEDRFGAAVAIDDDTIVIGAITDDHSSLSNPGAAYVFQRNGSIWSQAAKLVASDPATNDAFGHAVAIDAGTVAVRSASDPVAFGPSGAVYVFVGSGTSWLQQAKLTGLTYRMGESLSIYGNTIAVGSPYEDFGDPGNWFGAGAAEVFVRDGTTWSHQGLLAPSVHEFQAEFGHSVALHGDVLAVGEWGHANFEGAVHLFERNGTVWTPTAQLVSGDGPGGAFGSSVAFTDGFLAAGAQVMNAPGALSAGAVYLFERTGSTWIRRLELLAADPSSSAALGTSVAIDGDTIIAGAPDPVSGPGAAYVFRYWSPQRFCFGDGSLLTPCPCVPPNVVPSPSGSSDAGCANSLDLNGASLGARGSLFPETLAFQAQIASSYLGFGFLVKGTAQNVAGVPNGDGVRCVSGAFVRFGGHNAGTNGDASGSWSYPNAMQTIAVSVASAQTPGQTSYYQLLYRNAAPGFCSSGTTNWTNAISLTWN